MNYRKWLIFFISLQVELVYAQPGVLDNSFSGDGIFTFVVPGEQINHSTGIVLQTDGKYVIGGKINGPAEPRMVAIRINPDGSLDSSYGSDGYSASNVVFRSFAHTVGIQADQKVILLGQDYQPVGNLEDFGMIRLNTDGSLDPSFGNGGKAAIDYGLGEEGYKVIERPGGKLLIAGFSTWDIWSQTSEILKNNFCVGRLLSDGTKDSTFGVNGVFTLDLGDRNDYGTAMVVTADGKIISAGISSGFDGTYGAMFRLTEDGAPDSTFGINSVASSSVGIGSSWNCLVEQADGKLVVGGRRTVATNTYDLMVERFHAEGSADSSFSDNGVFQFDLGGKDEIVEDVKLQPDGKIIITGYSGEGNEAAAFVMRLKTDGSVDSTFGINGLFLHHISSAFDKVKDCLIDDEGKIVVTGFSQTTDGDTIFVFRLLSDFGTGMGNTSQDDPSKISLHLSPNPASNQISCSYFLPGESEVRLTLSNVLGERLVMISLSKEQQGQHQHLLQIPDFLASGFYYIILQTSNGTSAQPFILK